MIIILNFGSQFAHLIARRVRDLGVKAEILPFDTSAAKIKELNPSGIIFSGGPASVLKIILGSSSKYRRAVLEKNGYIFEVMSPDIDEKAIRTDDYYQLPLLLARAKADALIPRVSEDALVITSDQVVVCNGNLHEKPSGEEEARLFLERYGQGQAAETVSAIVVTNTANGKKAEGVDIAKTYYNFIPADVVTDFVKNSDPYTKAGGFAIQSPILQPYMNRIEGTEDSTMGMPLKLLEELFAQVK